MLDQEGVAFSRSWVTYEVGLGLKTHQRAKNFELASCLKKTGEPVVVCQGLSEEDTCQGQASEWCSTGGPYGHKVQVLSLICCYLICRLLIGLAGCVKVTVCLFS